MNDGNITWITSSYSGAAGHCVELGKDDPNDRILVRDTKDKGNGPILSFTRGEWDAFLAGAKDGEFDNL